MQRLQLLALLLVIFQLSLAFRIAQFGRTLGKIQCRSLSMAAEDEPGEADFAEADDPKLFEMNRRVRLGRSKDQDGKSNIWSIEPTMEVEEDEEGGGVAKKNLIVGGVVIGAALACLPLFNAFSTLFPDPSDF